MNSSSAARAQPHAYPKEHTPPRMPMDAGSNLPPPTPYRTMAAPIPSAAGRRPRPLRPGEDFLTDREPELPPSRMPLPSSSPDASASAGGRVGFQTEPPVIIGKSSYPLTGESEAGSGSSKRSRASASDASNQGSRDMDRGGDEGDADAASNVSQQASSVRSRSSKRTDVPGDVPSPFINPNLNQQQQHLLLNNYHSHYPRPPPHVPVRVPCAMPFRAYHSAGAAGMYHTGGGSRLRAAYWAGAGGGVYTVHVGESRRTFLAVVREGERVPSVVVEGGYLGDVPTSPCRLITPGSTTTNNKAAMKLFARRGRTVGDVRVVAKKAGSEGDGLVTVIVPAVMDVPCWPAATCGQRAPPGMEGAVISAVVVHGARIKGNARRTATAMRLVSSADGAREWVQTGDGAATELASLAYSHVPPDVAHVPPFARHAYPARLVVKDGVDVAVVASVLASRLWVYVLKGRGY